MIAAFTESTVDQAAVAWLEGSRWQIAHGPDILPVGDTLTPALSQWERESYGEVVIRTTLKAAAKAFLANRMWRRPSAF